MTRHENAGHEIAGHETTGHKIKQGMKLAEKWQTFEAE